MQHRIDELRADAARLAGQVLQQVGDAVEAYRTGNIELARRVSQSDREIDNAELEIERAAIDLLSLFRPAAGEFRLVITIIKINNDLERIADCASNIAERVRTLRADHDAAHTTYGVPKELAELGLIVTDLVRQTIQTFNYTDPQRARVVIAQDNRIDALYASVVQAQMTDMRADGEHVNRDMAHIMIAKNLERIGDHCTNIAEDIVYATSGEIIRHRSAV